MQALSAFEAAARLESFTAAARELGTTQPTVSQRIVQLKAELGAPLFDRSRRGVTLTADGRRLYEAVRQSLATLRDATAEIRGRRASGALTILTDAGFATFWLAPRLAGLKRLMHDVNVKLVTSQQGFDPRRDHADVAIAFGNDDWTPCTSTRLFREQVSPVCSPAFRAQHPRVRTAADLAALPRLHVQPTEPARWLSGAEWFAAHDLSAPVDEQGMTFNKQLRAGHQYGADGPGRGARLDAADRCADRGRPARAPDRQARCHRTWLFSRAPAGAPRSAHGSGLSPLVVCRKRHRRDTAH